MSSEQSIKRDLTKSRKANADRIKQDAISHPGMAGCGMDLTVVPEPEPHAPCWWCYPASFMPLPMQHPANLPKFKPPTYKPKPPVHRSLQEDYAYSQNQANSSQEYGSNCTNQESDDYIQQTPC